MGEKSECKDTMANISSTGEMDFSLTGCGDLDIGDLDLYRFWRQLSQNLTNLDKIKTNKDK